MSDLPEEVVADILSRLPVKSLLQFRCVSKPWCALIDGTNFMKSHLKRSIETKNNLSLILDDQDDLYSIDFESFDKAVKLDHPLKNEDFRTEVLGSCNGLLCLYNTVEGIVFWNPSIRKHRKLPVTPIEVRSGFYRRFVAYGFGHDAVNDDYKLVRMVQFCGQDNASVCSEVTVYNLKSNSCRRIPDFPYYLRYTQVNGVLAGGALHWLVTRMPEPDTAALIAAFDIGTEDYRLVPQRVYSDTIFHMNVRVIGDCLSISCNYYFPHSARIDIWVMKEYGVKESWTKLFSVARPSLIRSFDYVFTIAYSKSREKVLLEQDSGCLLWYDLKKKSVEYIWIGGLPIFFSTNVCLGSLVLLGVDGRSDGKKQPAQEKRKKKKNKKKNCKKR